MKNKNLIRYVLVLPKERYEEVRIIAEKEGRSVASVIRKFINLGLLVDKYDEVIIKEKGSDSEKRVILF